MSEEIEIITDAPIPIKAKKEMLRGRRQAAGKKVSPASSFIRALEFVAVAQAKTGEINLQFCHCFSHWVAAFDGILTVAHPIEEDLHACPQTYQLLEALKKTHEEVAFVQLDQHRLSIISGALRVLVPCVPVESVPVTPPDQAIAPLTNAVKAGFAAVLPLLSDTTENAPSGAVLLQAGSLVGMNSATLVEYWHGLDLPPGLLIPKAAVKAVAKSPYDLEGFGFSTSSVTFHFAGGSFIKTQLCKGQFADYAKAFKDVGELCHNTLPDFFNGVKTIGKLTKEGAVHFGENCITDGIEEGSTFACVGVPKGSIFFAKRLLEIEPICQKMYFENGRLYFFGDSVRGIVLGLEKGTE